jgi:hypothetical protein
MSNKFTVLTKKPSDYMLTISLNGMSTKQSARGSKVDLGFRHDAAVNWIMSTDEAGQWDLHGLDAAKHWLSGKQNIEAYMYARIS